MSPAEQLEEDIRSTGFYKNKAKSIKNIARELIERFHGKVPDDIDTFATVKGIGRKSANMIVGLAYGKPAMVVDTHMIRVSQRIGLTKNTDPEKIEVDLRACCASDRCGLIFPFSWSFMGDICARRKSLNAKDACCRNTAITT